MDLRECLSCKKKYQPVKANQKYCPVCKKKEPPKRELHTVVCPVCHTSFETDIYNRKYCCKSCLDYSKRDWSREKEKVCAHCGKTFKTTRENQKYCDRECGLKAKAVYDKLWRESHGL